MDNKYGVTKKGFRRKTFSECLESKIEKAKEVFGVNIDTSETSFFGTMLRNQAWDESEMWEKLEDVYLSAFVNYSTGHGLDNVSEYITISRNPATKSLTVLEFKGKNETVIPIGFVTKTENEVFFKTIELGTIVDGKCSIKSESIGAGKDNNVNANTISIIVNPKLGVDEVNNPNPSENGLDIETDEEFRERYHNSYSKGGGSTVDAIRAALLDLEDIVDADVKENSTMQEIDGIPPKSVACYVFGGTDEEIATTILKSKSGGIEAYGDTVIETIDKKNMKHKIGFTRAKKEDIFVNLTITKSSGYKGDDTVKRAVLNYIGGTDKDGIVYTGLKLGEDVVVSRIMAAVVCLGGVDDIKVDLSTTGKEFKSSNISIDNKTVAITEDSKVVIL